MACQLQTSNVNSMAARLMVVVIAVALTAGCAHVRRVGRPPSQEEVDEINSSTSGELGTFAIRYFDPSRPCEGGICTAEGPRPVFDVPPSEITRIVSVGAGQLTVVAQTGDVWHLELSKVAGVTTHHRATLAGGIAGGGFGFVLGGLTALFAGGGVPDAAYPQSPPPSSATVMAIMVTSTAVGALVGALVGHAVFARDSFEIGDTGLSSEPSSEFGR
jgi:hypothetical protein